mmetsp:Transcript_9673/g.24770  ORF Transcript_9673/g.24770 Transcript_9673/m.24770 type:complete len:200 (-) Transcript_9673:3558-4157(-)
MDQLGTHLNTTSAPFFVHLSFLSPHPPDTPPLPWDTYYDEGDLPPINYEAGDVFKLPYQTRMLLGLLGDDPQSYMLDDYSLNTTQVDAARLLYHGLAAYVDSQLGRMADWIDDQGLASSTLLIFTSDHGAMLRPRHRQRQALVPRVVLEGAYVHEAARCPAGQHDRRLRHHHRRDRVHSRGVWRRLGAAGAVLLERRRD